MIEGYRSGSLSHYQGSQVLAMSRLEFDAFLKSRDLHEYAYGMEEFKADENTLRQLESKGII